MAASYQGESRMLDSPDGLCVGEAGSEYPPTSAPFSKLGALEPLCDPDDSGEQTAESAKLLLNGAAFLAIGLEPTAHIPPWDVFSGRQMPHRTP
jgi:hypothetical protein